MTTGRKQTAAKTAGSIPPAETAFAARSDVRSLPLRRNRDAVCRDRSADGAEFPGSSSISKNFLTSRMKSQPQTRKETPNTTQEKKGKKQQEQNSLQLETLA